MPTLTLMAAGDEFKKTDSFDTSAPTLDNVLAMINERRVKAGLSAAAWSEIYNLTSNPDAPKGEDINIALINFLRDKLVDAITLYLNTDVHSGGSLEGASTITFWTKATVLTSAGIGGNEGGIRQWTNVPSDGDAQDLIDFSVTQYSSHLITGPTLYKVWINELIQVCRKLTHLSKNATETAVEIRICNERFDASCSGAQSCALGHLPGVAYGTVEEYITSCTYVSTASWGFSVRIGKEISTLASDSPSIIYSCSAFNSRGKLTCDLSAYSSGTAKVFLSLSASNYFNQNVSNGSISFGQSRPVSSDENKYGEWTGSGVALGSVWTSGYVTDSDTIPSSISCAVPASPANINIDGWIIASAKVIIAPTFTYL